MPLKVAENTFQKLAFTMGIPKFFCFECVFDRASGAATIARRIFFVPLPIKQIRLADIDRVILQQERLTSQERANGELAQSYPILLMRDASKVRLMMSTGAGAKWAVEAINTFLQASR